MVKIRPLELLAAHEIGNPERDLYAIPDKSVPAWVLVHAGVKCRRIKWDLRNCRSSLIPVISDFMIS